MNADNARASATLNDPRWPRVLMRDATADGEFFYSVGSTGVYCRPSCAARRARPEHIEFHATAEEAQRAGFRPCKRCRPDRLAADACDACEGIRHAIAQSSLGRVLVATSEHGLCAILLGDDDAALEHELHRRFPAARIKEDAPALAAIAAQVVDLIESPATARFNLSLDVRGTSFQRRVWQALREIDAGSTANYAQIAARIGAPKSARAVAQACSANPLAVAIPCHRVIRGDGTLSGYRWGVQRKRALLQREGCAA
ncbi:MAG TPA: methylated-DNA--[protein]-cysteine S-methyltransferase [Rhodanobacteraceae bacterium]|jgi:AraC family transcriptional regulator of adaptative response/methylated-DNA-[protein]-cysteine methyltransferase|nr:methylated-DNA--[protein]-cysteine S-methyltransferase [Rhodanobacteraceae bacterium]